MILCWFQVAFRYTIVMTGLCTLAPVLDLTTWVFAITSLPVNGYFMWLGWRFYRQGDSQSSRALFRFSLIHIPALIVLMLISKKTFGDGAKKKPSGIMDSNPVKSVSNDNVKNFKDSTSIASSPSASS